jgi:hypothetical protein
VAAFREGSALPILDGLLADEEANNLEDAFDFVFI